MGTIIHNAIVVTGFNREKLVELRKFAKNVLLIKNIPKVSKSGTNGYATLIIPPDGSKEGWDESDKGDEARSVFIKHLRTTFDHTYEWLEIEYGIDKESEPEIINHSYYDNLEESPGFEEVDPYGIKKIGMIQLNHVTDEEIEADKDWNRVFPQLEIKVDKERSNDVTTFYVPFNHQPAKKILKKHENGIQFAIGVNKYGEQTINYVNTEVHENAKAEFEIDTIESLRNLYHAHESRFWSLFFESLIEIFETLGLEELQYEDEVRLKPFVKLIVGVE